MAHAWYAVQTTAGHENKVRSLIERHINADQRPEEERPIRRALVPMKPDVEIKNGKKVTVERKVFPGYVLVEMAMRSAPRTILAPRLALRVLALVLRREVVPTLTVSTLHYDLISCHVSVGQADCRTVR